MGKKGFFEFNKRTMLFIAAVVVFAIIMFTSPIFYSTTARGTSMQFVFVNIILIAAPALALIDAFMSKDKSGR